MINGIKVLLILGGDLGEKLVQTDAAGYDDLTLNFRLMFIHETNQVLLDILDYEDNIGFSGVCEFSPEKLIIKIDKKSDNLFYGKYDKIIFKKAEF